MSIIPILTMYLIQEEYEQERRRKEERIRRREEEEKRQKRNNERKRRIEEQRRNAPLEFNDEEWQRERCLKVISLNEDVKQLINILQLKRQEIIENDIKEIDEYLESISRDYEWQRKQVESAIKILENLNVKVSGSQCHLSRVGMFNLVGTLDMKIDSLGEVFSPNMKKGIRINEEILSSDNVYKLAYERTKPKETQQLYDEVTKKVNKYKKIGKYLKFILSRDEYMTLEAKQRQLSEDLEYVNETKESLDSYNSLTKVQLEGIKNYLKELQELQSISCKIEIKYDKKKTLRYNESNEIYKRALALAIADDELKPLVIEAMEYIKKICSNNEKVMEAGKKILDEHQGEEIENQIVCDFLVSARKLIYDKLDGITEIYNQKKHIKM